MKKNNRRIAILGAGGLGTCTALELAGRGYNIDLYEEHAQPIKKASYVNEGKIHLGFIYAMDKNLHTAQQMITGALHFISNLKRWIKIDPENIISTPFNYCIHKGSLMNVSELKHHYKKCIEIFEVTKHHYKKNYLDLFDKINATQLSSSEAEKVINPEYIDAVFSTNEYSVEPRTIAENLTRTLFETPKINLFLNSKIKSVSKNGSLLNVKIKQKDVVIEEEYTDVINATWNGMLKIDNSMGINPPGKWSHRYKFGNKILVPLSATAFHSCTMVQGPYGDTVNFKDKGAFISWYPIGRTGWSEELRPPEWDKTLSESERMQIFTRSFEELKKRIPALVNIKFEQENVSPVGGIIYALGNEDVDNYQSKLHTRHEVGIRSFDNYHTVNTGKYTLIPYLAVKTADRIEGIS